MSDTTSYVQVSRRIVLVLGMLAAIGTAVVAMLSVNVELSKSRLSGAVWKADGKTTLDSSILGEHWEQVFPALSQDTKSLRKMMMHGAIVGSTVDVSNLIADGSVVRHLRSYALPKTASKQLKKCITYQMPNALHVRKLDTADDYDLAMLQGSYLIEWRRVVYADMTRRDTINHNFCDVLETQEALVSGDEKETLRRIRDRFQDTQPQVRITMKDWSEYRRIAFTLDGQVLPDLRWYFRRSTSTFAFVPVTNGRYSLIEDKNFPAPSTTVEVGNWRRLTLTDTALLRSSTFATSFVPNFVVGVPSGSTIAWYVPFPETYDDEFQSEADAHEDAERGYAPLRMHHVLELDRTVNSRSSNHIRLRSSKLPTRRLALQNLVAIPANDSAIDSSWTQISSLPQWLKMRDFDENVIQSHDPFTVRPDDLVNSTILSNTVFATEVHSTDYVTLSGGAGEPTVYAMPMRAGQIMRGIIGCQWQVVKLSDPMAEGYEELKLGSLPIPDVTRGWTLWTGGAPPTAWRKLDDTNLYGTVTADGPPFIPTSWNQVVPPGTYVESSGTYVFNPGLTSAESLFRSNGAAPLLPESAKIDLRRLVGPGDDLYDFLAEHCRFNSFIKLKDSYVLIVDPDSYYVYRPVYDVPPPVSEPKPPAHYLSRHVHDSKKYPLSHIPYQAWRKVSSMPSTVDNRIDGKSAWHLQLPPTSKSQKNLAVAWSELHDAGSQFMYDYTIDAVVNAECSSHIFRPSSEFRASEDDVVLSYVRYTGPVDEQFLDFKVFELSTVVLNATPRAQRIVDALTGRDPPGLNLKDMHVLRRLLGALPVAYQDPHNNILSIANKSVHFIPCRRDTTSLIWKPVRIGLGLDVDSFASRYDDVWTGLKATQILDSIDSGLPIVYAESVKVGTMLDAGDGRYAVPAFVHPNAFSTAKALDFYGFQSEVEPDVAKRSTLQSASYVVTDRTCFVTYGASGLHFWVPVPHVSTAQILSITKNKADVMDRFRIMDYDPDLVGLLNSTALKDLSAFVCTNDPRKGTVAALERTDSTFITPLILFSAFIFVIYNTLLYGVGDDVPFHRTIVQMFARANVMLSAHYFTTRFSYADVKSRQAMVALYAERTAYVAGGLGAALLLFSVLRDRRNIAFGVVTPIFVLAYAMNAAIFIGDIELNILGTHWTDVSTEPTTGKDVTPSVRNSSIGPLLSAGTVTFSIHDIKHSGLMLSKGDYVRIGDQYFVADVDVRVAEKPARVQMMYNLLLAHFFNVHYLAVIYASVHAGSMRERYRRQ